MYQLAYKKKFFHSTVGLLVPDFYAATVFDIDFPYLRSQGITCVAVDIDNTLVPDKEPMLADPTTDFFVQKKQEGYIQTLAIATNRSTKNMESIAEAMRVDVAFSAKGLSRKPFRSYFRDLLQAMDCNPEHTVMIGDKVIQDVYGGNRMGLKTILVDPLGPALWFEKLLYRYVRSQSNSELISDAFLDE